MLFGGFSVRFSIQIADGTQKVKNIQLSGSIKIPTQINKLYKMFLLI